MKPRFLGLLSVCIILPALFVVCKSNRPPGEIELLGPSWGLPSDTLTYYVVARDPEDLGVAFMVDWGDTTPLEWTPYYGSGQTVTRKHAYLSEGTYRIRVRARDTEENESEWCNSRTVAIGYEPQGGAPRQPDHRGGDRQHRPDFLDRADRGHARQVPGVLHGG